MADQDAVDPEPARSRLLTLFEGDEWRFTNRARLEGKLILQSLRGREPTDVEMVDHVISLLKKGTTLRCAPQGDPPGSTGVAWQLTDQEGLFVKLRIEGGFGQKIPQEYALIQSIHKSVHRK